MRSCPLCGALARDDATFCDIDGARLDPLASASRFPEDAAGHRCVFCGLRNADVVEGFCAECGHRLVAARQTKPGPPPARIDDFSVVRRHTDCDWVVRDPAGANKLLVLGPDAPLDDEEAALLALEGSAFFPARASRGRWTGLQSYLVLDRDLDGSTPLDGARLSVRQALSVLERILDAADELRSKGLAWNPWEADLRLLPSGDICFARARGARRLDDPGDFDVKHVLEVLGASLLPAPIGRSTPGLVRLLLPATNFSTPDGLTAEAAREELVRAIATLEAQEGRKAATLCDPGLRRPHNQDATALVEGNVRGEPFTVLVVCDGVSSSAHAERASAIAAEVAADGIARFAGSGRMLTEDARPALVAAIHGAHDAICADHFDLDARPPPGTTIVCAIVFRRRLTVGWVGDSRAYLVAGDESLLCTSDHSWLNEAIASGQWSEEAALSSPLAHALTRCLGPLETDGEEDSPTRAAPDVRSFELTAPTCVMLCSDGLWNYFPSAGSIADIVKDAGPGAHADAVARCLVCHALIRGGGDNVSVAVQLVD